MSYPEAAWLAAALLAYAGTLACGIADWRRGGWQRAALGLMALGLVLHGVSLGVRWVDAGHGPYVSLFEVLSGNIWSLLLMFLATALLAPSVRVGTPVAMAVIAVMGAWMLTEPAEPAPPPASFDTFILWIHLVLGKVFLGLSLAAAAVGGAVMARRAGLGGAGLARGPDDAHLETVAYRLLGIALMFETLMLVAGGAFAQEAWGRFWGWDKLETLSLLTWVLAAFALHYRASRRPGPVTAALLLWAVFALAFLTLFGVPFLSDHPHQGTFSASGAPS